MNQPGDKPMTILIFSKVIAKDDAIATWFLTKLFERHEITNSKGFIGDDPNPVLLGGLNHPPDPLGC